MCRVCFWCWSYCCRDAWYEMLWDCVYELLILYIYCLYTFMNAGPPVIIGLVLFSQVLTSYTLHYHIYTIQSYILPYPLLILIDPSVCTCVFARPSGALWTRRSHSPWTPTHGRYSIHRTLHYSICYTLFYAFVEWSMCMAFSVLFSTSYAILNHTLYTVYVNVCTCMYNYMYIYRSNEFAADKYAADLGMADDLASGLVKISIGKGVWVYMWYIYVIWVRLCLQ